MYIRTEGVDLSHSRQVGMWGFHSLRIRLNFLLCMWLKRIYDVMANHKGNGSSRSLIIEEES